MLKFLTSIFALAALSLGLGCSGFQSSMPEGKLMKDLELLVQQNSSKSVEIEEAGVTALKITTEAVNGVITIKGTTLTYTPNDALFIGEDSFKFQVAVGTSWSPDVNAKVIVTKIANKTYLFSETYDGLGYQLEGWKNYSSSFGAGTITPNIFEAGTFNGMPVFARAFKLYGDSNSYLGDAAYISKFGTVPVDGTGGVMGDFPWKAETIHLPECMVDVTITAEVNPNAGLFPMGAILLNYRVDQNSLATKLTGYQLLFNSGGGSLTLSRFDQADEAATAFMDRWPNTNFGNEANANPVVHGPYKGWNYKSGSWPAGGIVGVGAFLVAARYQYNPATKVTTISYEVRKSDGTDLTPTSWDEVVTISGSDSFKPGGDFGMMALNWHQGSMIAPTDFDLSNFEMKCKVP